MVGINALMVMVVAATLLSGCSGDSAPVIEPLSNPKYIPSSLKKLDAITYADIDNDGDQDLVAKGNNGAMYWYKNNQADGFDELLIATDIYEAYDIDVIDFNQDGQLDIIVFDSERNLVMYKGTAGADNAIEFNKTVIKLSNSGCDIFCELEVSDFNNDGILDLVHCSVSLCHLLTFSDVNKNIYSEYSFSVNPYVTNLKAADLNADGRIDLSYTAYSRQSAFLMLNIGESLGFRQIEIIVDHAYGAAAIQDVNQDGATDIVSTIGVHFGRLEGTTLKLDTQSIGLPRPTSNVGLPISYLYSSFLAYDIDMDGDNDIISTNKAGAYYYFENSSGDGEEYIQGFSFAPSGPNPLFYVPLDDSQGKSTTRPIRITDLDNDGYPDLLFNQLIDGQIVWSDIQSLINEPFIKD